MPGGRPSKPPSLKARTASFKLPPDLLAQLRERADRDRTSQAAVVVKALRAYLAEPPEPPPPTA